MQYRFYLDGNLMTENPIGWDAILVKVDRDNDLKGVLIRLEATLTFRADGYDYLRNIFDNSDYCSVTEISVHRSIDDGQNFIEHYKGLLFLSEDGFDDFNCSVTTEFVDDSFYGKIDKRRSAEAYLTGGSTINGEDLTPCLIRQAQYFDPANGSTIGPNGPLTQANGCWKVYDVLEYMISYMTDNEVEFSSPLFGVSGDFANQMLTFGYAIRQTGNGVALTLAQIIENIPPITFQKLFTELNKRYNIGFFVDLSGAKPKVVIDYWKQLFRGNVITTFPDLPNLKTEIAKELIYSSIKFGGNKTLDLIAASFPEAVRFVGFNSEQYVITGKCNIENILDLSYDFVSSSNIIEQILILSGTDTSYDQDWFLIDATAGPGNELIATQSNWLTASPPFFYNEKQTNYEISKRYLGFVPNSIAAYLSSGDDTFLATKTLNQGPTFGNPVPVTQIIFEDDVNPPNHDVDNNYDPLTGRYTIPISGVYTFEAFLREFYTPIGNIAYNVSVYMERYDNTSTLIESRKVGNLYVQYGVITGTFTSTFIANATEYIIVGFREDYSFNNAVILPGSTFACTASTNGGGVYQTYEPADYPIIKNIFSTNIVQSQTDAITAEPLSLIQFYIEATTQKQAWVDEISINEFTGRIDAKLLRARNGIGVTFPPELRAVQFTGSLPQIPFTLSVADYYGNPSPVDSTTSKMFFFEVGKDITISIPSTFLGLNAGDISNQTIVITENLPGNVFNVYRYYAPDLSATFTVMSGASYIVQLGYDTNTVGDTYPVVVPVIGAPSVAGGNGSVVITAISPNNISDYTFAWSNGGITNSITDVAGDYTCLVTYALGGFDHNSFTLHVQIPISITGA